MRTDLTNRLRAILRGHPDGLTVTALMDMTGVNNRASVGTRLRAMPDTYIDRWEKGPNNYASVWCVVTPPNDCPHPTRQVVAVRTRRWRDTREDEQDRVTRRESGND